MRIRIINAEATPAPASPNVVLLCLVVVLIVFNVWAMWRWRITIKAWGRTLEEWNACRCELKAEREKGSSRS